MKQGWKAAGAALTAAGGLAGTAFALTGLMMDEALDRREPELMKKAKSRMVTGGVKDPLALSAAAASATLRAVPMERVEITAWDGTPLVGHWRSCENPRRVIVAMHGWRSAWYRDFGASADFWHGSGCCVLYAEQRGQGDSGGEYMCFGIKERRDCLDWLRWANKRTGGALPAYLAGISMGATTVLMASGLPGLPANLRGIMADCGFTSAEDIWRHVAQKNYRLPYRPFRPMIHRICRNRLGEAPDCCSTAQALRSAALPVFFAHGEDDGFVPPEMTLKNFEACAGPKRLLLVPGARHGMSYLVQREKYEAMVRDFWREFDGDATSDPA